MKEIKSFLVNNGFCDIEEYEGVITCCKTIVENEFIFQIVAPHDGTKNKWMLRADSIENHDRWSNCDYETFYENIDDLKKNWNEEESEITKTITTQRREACDEI